MAMEPRLGIQVKLSQKLVLTPQLHQAIKLLQMSQLELSQTLNQELMENPFLEEVIDVEQDENTTLMENENGAEPIEENLEKDLVDNFENMFGFTTDDYFDERGSDGRDLGYFTQGTDEQPFFEKTSNIRSDIYEHLLWQLRLSHAPELHRLIAEIIIGNLDENGYLKTTLDEIAEMAGIDIGLTEESLKLIQGFDPAGVGARNIQECLVLQLRELEQKNPLVEKIIKDGFDELKKKKYQQLAVMFKVHVEDILEAAQIIGRLEPRPGRNYTNDTTNYITPDVFIFEINGGYTIILNDEGLPRLKLSRQYRNLLMNKKKLLEDERKFLIEKLKSASWLMKTLDQRNKTIYRVTECILKFQEEFFKKGVKGLKPLNLRDVAMELGMHESTISRVTSNKYLQCSHGILGFRYFFGSAIQSTSGEVSSAKVKDMILKIVSEEHPSHPYSDGKIVELLKKEKINIARRTVAKYRDELKIPPLSRRKKIKK